MANGGTGATTADAARANLGLNGTIISTSARKTVASGTATVIASISLSQPGLYIIMSRAQFDSNANGYRIVHPRAGSTNYAGQTVRAISGAVTEISSFDFLGISEATTLSVVVEHDSGSSLGVTGWVGAYRLRAQ